MVKSAVPGVAPALWHNHVVGHFSTEKTYTSHKNMKNKIKLLVFVAPLLICGCVATTYTKTVTVTKDASGVVIGRVETESVTQPNQQGWPVKFEYLKGVQTGEK